ncbi:sigma-70 family RNA polymerase sigma factor [Lujinxingia vulgaris]|uniref:RNA polymerase sigma factor n=1 Tax=Lujinxingia vulgaris TaxID=2600176 RepID=A0A5C6X999_9DELT|nr:sigma-70 family RNA polymerase sigma factor [Lujinxingia vulgaris]TXD33809.1 sigma-70 family RNA polymerase sigma factor [Lujinxingia vulgaris]
MTTASSDTSNASNPSHTALESTLLAHREQLLAFVRSRGLDASSAEDLLQDSLIKAMGSFEQLEDEEKLIAWFYQILRNGIIDRQRRVQTRRKYAERYGQEQEWVETPEERANVCQCFRKLIPTLKDEYQEVIEAVELGEAETEALAAELGITTNNLNVRRHRARKQLKGRLEETCGACAASGCLDCTCEH